MPKNKAKLPTLEVETTQAEDQVVRRHRTPAQIEIDRRTMLGLMRKGWSVVDVAANLGVHPSTIRQDWKIVLKQIQEDTSDQTKALIALKIEEYRLIKMEAWAAWEASKADKVRTTTEGWEYLDDEGQPTAPPKRTNKKGKGELDELDELLTRAPNKRKVQEMREGRLPSAEYLKIVMQCIAAERELLGLNPALEVNINGTMTWDELAASIPEGDVPDEVEAKIKQLMHAETSVTADGQPMVLEVEAQPVRSRAT